MKARLLLLLMGYDCLIMHKARYENRYPSHITVLSIDSLRLTAKWILSFFIKKLLSVHTLLICNLFLTPSVLKAMYKSEALARQKSAMNTAKSTSSTLIPGFESASPMEVELNHPQALEGSAERVFLHNETAKMLKQTSETRPYFPLDLNHDPLIKNSNDSVNDPEKVLASDLYSKNSSTNYVIQTCREGKPPIEFKCSKTLVPPIVHVDPAKYSNYWCTSGKHRPDNPKCKSKKYYPTPRMYEAEKVSISP